MDKQLEAFVPYVGRTWKGLVNADHQVYDVARWELALKGRAIRIIHSVANGAYGGESVIVWDHSTGKLLYTYFTTASFYTQGMGFVADDKRIFFEEEVIGEAGGVSRNEVWMEITSDGMLRKTVRTLRSGAWSPWTDVFYVEAPGEIVILD